ncbi:MAG: hypothetical protein ACRC10_03795 [Thermoguttaceae bacterium]
MDVQKSMAQVLAEYPREFRAETVESLGHPSGLSGAEYWKVATPSGLFCLRRWKRGTPILNQLEFSQAVLWYLTFEGFDLVPLPCETVEHKGYVQHAGFIWELLPWIGGESDLAFNPNTLAVFSDEAFDRLFTGLPTESGRIVSAMQTLARLHELSSGFPLPNEAVGKSPAALNYLAIWREWIDGKIHTLIEQVKNGKKRAKSALEFELVRESQSLIERFFAFGSNGMLMLLRGSQLYVPIQPVLGNASRRHLRFDSSGVCGILDFKEMRADSVVRDVVSLLGSLAGSDLKLWICGLRAYQTIRQLQDEEIYLATVLDFADILLGGLSWLELIYLEKETYTTAQLGAIVGQLHWQLNRLPHLSTGRSLAVA